MSLKIAASLFFALSTLLPAVEFRVATFNIGAKFVGSGVDYSLGDPGTPDYEAVKAVLGRINADVVGLEEIASDDVSGSPSDISTLATSLGYPYIYIAPTSAASPLTGPFDTALRVCFISKYPFLSTQVIRSPEGARELTRLFPVVRVDIPGTNKDPVLIAGHLKSGSDRADRFRRAIELKRLAAYLNSQGLTTDDNFIIMGDFNLSSSNTTFTELPTGLPTTYDLGDDVTLPLTYSTNAVSYFTNPAVTRVIPTQLNGSTVTFPTSSSTIDVFLLSQAFAGRALATEVYNSNLDTSNSSGLPKSGSPLAPETSSAASDHLALFGDFELDSDFPNLDLTFSSPTVTEASADGTVTLTVTLPASRSTALSVNISSDDPAAIPISPTVVIPAGSLSASVAVRTPRNFIEEEGRSVTFTASASSYDPDSAVLQVTNIEGPYVFSVPGQTITETFDGFSGDHDPAPWVTSGLTWQGVDDGSSTTVGFRAYGTTAESSLGLLPGITPGTATASFVNQTASVLTALQISFTAEQWRAALGGTADTLSVELIQGAVATPLPSLTFASATNLPTGAIAGGNSVLKTANVTGLSVAPGTSFQLRFTFTPGSGGEVDPSDVFINEFHYDNVGTDVGEFVEVVVAPGFTGELSDIDIVLYNGDVATGGVVYATKNLGGTDFPPPTTSNGYQILTTDVVIQNGPRDGFAVYNKVTEQVLHFISFEGSFTASDGPAAGMTAIDIGVSQSTAPAAGSSLGLTGPGGIYSDFTWATSIGSNTKGSPNTNQTFASPARPSQGISFDNLSVTFVSDPNADSDGDGFSDAEELVHGTDPQNPASFFSMSFAYPSPVAGSVRLTFSTVSGRSYTLQSGTNLILWEDGTSYEGTGSARVADVAVIPGDPKRFYRIRVTRP